MNFYTDEELEGIGFAAVGRDVKLSRKASIHGASHIYIADQVRIDDFAVLSAGPEGIHIGSHVHIAVFCSLIGKARITLGDYAGLSARCSVFSASDDFSGNFLTGPTVPDEYTNIAAHPVYIGRHVVVGAATVILPGAKLNDCSAVGAMSLVKGELEGFTIYGGIPAMPIRKRHHRLLELEKLMGEAGRG
jgi:galactoside O-acetyltransferase